MKVVAPNNHHGWWIGEAISKPSFSCFYVGLSARQVRHQSMHLHSVSACGWPATMHAELPSSTRPTRKKWEKMWPILTARGTTRGRGPKTKDRSCSSGLLFLCLVLALGTQMPCCSCSLGSLTEAATPPKAHCPPLQLHAAGSSPPLRREEALEVRPACIASETHTPGLLCSTRGSGDVTLAASCGGVTVGFQPASQPASQPALRAPM
jgi:hypothetical protein